MGLDAVEIVMGWEDDFDLRIPDEVATGLLTPRDATDYLFRRVESRPSSECIRQQTFFRLRRGFRRACGPWRAHFAPTTGLRAIVTRRDWPAAWETIRREVPSYVWPQRAPFAGRIAFSRRTVGDLVHELSLSDPRGFRRRDEPWTREMVSLQVRRVVNEVVGARYFDEDASFVDDLGIR